MPLFLCRWPNGDFSAVLASSEQDALIKLDEVDNAEGCPLVRVDDFQVHFQRAHSRFPGHALTPTGVMAIRCKQFHRPDL